MVRFNDYKQPEPAPLLRPGMISRGGLGGGGQEGQPAEAGGGEGSIAQLLQDTELGSGTQAAPPVQTQDQAPQQPSLIKQFFRAKFGLPDPQQQADQRAYRQQMAIQHYTDQLQQEEKAAQDWGDKALAQNKVVGETESLLARIPPTARSYKTVQEKLAREQQIFQVLTDRAKTHGQHADFFKTKLPGMIATAQPPSMGQGAGGTAGKAGKQSKQAFPALPSSSKYEQPSYSSPSDTMAKPKAKQIPEFNDETVAPESAPADNVAEAAAAASPAQEWEGVLRQAYGLPKGEVIDGRVSYSANKPGEAEYIRSQIKNAQEDLGVKDIPAFVEDSYGASLQASNDYRAWSVVARSDVAKASMFKNLENATKDEGELQRMLAYSMAPETRDPEMEANVRTILSTTMDKRVAVVRSIVDRYEGYAKESQGMADGFRGGAMQHRQQVSPGPVAPVGTTSEMRDVDAFSESYAIAQGWKKPGDPTPKLTDKQRADLKKAILEWQAKGAASGR